MRFAVFGDVGNDYEGLEGFFKESENHSIEMYLCTGNIARCSLSSDGQITNKNFLWKVNNCVNVLDKYGDKYGVEAILGNHDKKLIELQPNFLWVGTMDYLRSLETELLVGEAVLLHEFPRDDPLFSLGEREIELFRQQYPRQRILFYGQTQKRSLVQKFSENGKVRCWNIPAFEKQYDVSSGIHLVNPGCIEGVHNGNDGRNERPSFVVYDDKQQTVTFHRVPRA